MSNRKQRRANKQKGGVPWTSADVLGLLTNPLYAGLGGFPPIVEESTWALILAQLPERGWRA